MTKALIAVLIALLLWCAYLLSCKQVDKVHITVPRRGKPTVTWNVSKLRIPVFRGKLVCEIFADEARSDDGQGVELDNPTIFYYGEGIVTKVTGQKGTGELVDGDLKNLRVWGKTHIERRQSRPKEKRSQ